MSEPTSPFTRIESALARGPEAAIEALVETLRERKQYPQLFEALLLRKRRELGLPLLGVDTFREIPEPLQDEVEEYYIEVCRTVGALYLADGDILSAWPYYRAIDELKPVAAAIEAWTPPDEEREFQSHETAGPTIDAIIDIAFHQGAHPRRGFEQILAHHGVCRAITIIEHQFPHGWSVKQECAALLVRRLHQDLLASVRHDIARREGDGAKTPAAAGDSSQEGDLRALIEAHPSIFEDHGYHIDLSHLQSVVRLGASLSDRETLQLALQLAEYGRRLPRDFHMHDQPPFDDFYNDYRIFIQAILGVGVDGAIRYFTQKADRATLDDEGKHFPGEVLVYLLHRVGKRQEAIAASLRYLKDVRVPLTAAPTLFDLCAKAGDFRALIELSRERDDLLHFTAGVLQAAALQAPASDDVNPGSSGTPLPAGSSPTPSRSD